MTDSQRQTELLRAVRLALQQDDYPKAIASLKEAITLSKKSGDLGAAGRHMGNLALLYYRLKQPDKALQYFQEALDNARANGDRATEDGLLGNMGNILRELGRYDESITYLNQALLIAQEIGDVRGRGIWLGNLGLVYDDLKQHDKAIELHQESIRVARELNDQRGLTSRLSNLGNSYVSIGQYDKAIKIFEEAVSLHEQLGDEQGLALRLGIIGNIHAEMGRQKMPDISAGEHLQQALGYYGQTLNIARKLGDQASEGELLRSMGNVLALLGQYDSSLQYFNTAYKLFKKMGFSQQAEQARQLIQVVSDHRDTMQKDD